MDSDQRDSDVFNACDYTGNEFRFWVDIEKFQRDGNIHYFAHHLGIEP